MTFKDWFYLAITGASYLIALIAGLYAKNKSKINRATKAGQAMDVLGKLATSAVAEAEHTGMEGSDKREFAAEVISQGLQWFGIKTITPNAINGAIEHAVTEMQTANQDVANDISDDVEVDDVVKPGEENE